MGDTTVCSYVGRLRDTHKIFRTEKEARFTLGDQDTVMGLELGLRHMMPNSKALVQCEGKYGFGPGRISTSPDEAAIPPDAWLEYEVELHRVVRMSVAELPEKLCHAEFLKRNGNDQFKHKEWKRALKSYAQALKCLQDEEGPDVHVLRVDCLNNQVPCHAKMEEWNKAKQACVDVLQLDPNNVKALYRAGESAMALADWDEAEMAWKEALKLDPEGKAVSAASALGKLNKKRIEHERREKKAYAGKFNKVLTTPDLTPPPEPTPNPEPTPQLTSDPTPAPILTRAPTPCVAKEKATHPDKSVDTDVSPKSLLRLVLGILLVFALAAWQPEPWL
uniref:peptidylprolyl isomerase n=1 Tax=Eutreptiella gymnastica TaxID=73025 RepID=A0A7S1J0N4_9EUGL|mmetsp:Transcript_57135/g.102089  ORF Transcript_57135/g.102089 Transcript_57135/m.102089 type:complete len:334 (+) Transcript_57135:106-1107(+)